MASKMVYIYKLFFLSYFLPMSKPSILQEATELFKCRDSSTIPYSLFCNGRMDCADRSDEIFDFRFQSFPPLSNWQTCDNPRNGFNGSCLVRRTSICEEEIFCSNLDPCDLKCDSHYRCQNSGECVSRSTLCNVNPCDGCVEDHGWANGVGFKCFRDGRECVLPQQLLHDDVPDCDGGTDLCFGAITSLSATSRGERQSSKNIFEGRCFQCLGGDMVVPTSRVCDGVIDCDDLSDECLCDGASRPKICHRVVEEVRKEKKTHGGGEVIELSDATKNAVVTLPQRGVNNCDVGMVKCGSGVCIPRSSVCDGFRDCDIDEGFEYCQGTISCSESIGYEDVCRCSMGSRSNCYNDYGTACNGVADCPIRSSRNMIVTTAINKFPEDECHATCKREPKFSCGEPAFAAIGISESIFLCDLPTSETSVPNRHQVQWISGRKQCDGFEDCLYGEDESNCPQRFKCDAVKLGLVSIRIEQTCDGIKDCKNGSDESEGFCGKTRFQCPALGGKRVNIDKGLVCDFFIACDDESDEKNCNDSRFYCENGNPLFVRGQQKFDGRGDCSDWSDECPMLDQSETRNVFSSRYELIANPILRALVWIMGLLSLCGNATVMGIEMKKLLSKKTSTAGALANRLLVLNLAASDLLMGIYLIGLGIAGAAMEGVYCSQDLQWRSSSFCVGLGIIAVLSSETSVLTMIMLTSCRLYAVLKPFKSSSRPRKRVVGMMIISTWAISLTIALLPLAPQLSGIFVTHSQFQHAPYFRNVQITLDEARQHFKLLMAYDKKPNVTIPAGFSPNGLSWRELESRSNTLLNHDHFKIEKMFGYYSINSVCIPKFFIEKSEQAWKFSFFVNLFNFCAFMFVASSYAVIYIKSKGKAKIRQARTDSVKKGSSGLQRKILRLIITDFCCWIPICLLAFIKLGGVYVCNTAYVFAAIVLLPINSALNPLLYSNLPDLLYKFICTRSTQLPETDANFSERGRTETSRL